MDLVLENEILKSSSGWWVSGENFIHLINLLITTKYVFFISWHHHVDYAALAGKKNQDFTQQSFELNEDTMWNV